MGGIPQGPPQMQNRPMPQFSPMAGGMPQGQPNLQSQPFPQQGQPPMGGQGGMGGMDPQMIQQLMGNPQMMQMILQLFGSRRQ